MLQGYNIIVIHYTVLLPRWYTSTLVTITPPTNPNVITVKVRLKITLAKMKGF